MRTIVVSAYDSRWPTYFEQIRSVVWPAVQDIALSIEHVGSTAVPGLAAKPIIDIDIVIPSKDVLDTTVQRLEALGYKHQGDLGIAGRDAFKQQNDLPRHNLYVCPAGSVGLRNHLALRDYLRAHPEAIEAYSALKRHLVATVANDIDLYVDGKTDLITTFLREAGLASEDVAAIDRANRIA